MTLRICHLADIHLGYRKYNKLTKTGLNQREVDVTVAFREAIDRVIHIKPDVTVIAGDLFHAVRPSNSIVTFCFKELRRLTVATGSPVVIIAGNHETPKRSDTGCILRLFSEIPGIFIADSRPEVFTFKELNLSVCAVPHAALSRLDEFSIHADDNFKHNILVTHAQVNERWISDFGGVAIDLSALSFNEWDYVALGHVHFARKKGHNCWYSGAIEHTSNNIWAEAGEPKGFLEVTLPDLKVTFHSLTSPREVKVLPPIDAKGLDPDAILSLIEQSMKDVSGGIEGKILKLEVENVSRDVYRQLDHKSLRQFRASALHLALEIRSPEVVQGTQSLTETKRIGLTAELINFCKNHDQLDPQMITAIEPLIMQYLKKVEEANEAPST